MRLLVIAPFASPIDERAEQLGGAQVALADVARGLADRGHTVVLAAATGSFVRGTRQAPLAIDSGPMRAAALTSTAGERPDAAAQRDAFARVRAWLDAHADEIDAVHAHAYDAPAFESLVGAPRPVMHTLHLPPLDARVVAAARAATDSVLVTVSEANARAWRAAGVRVRHVIPNGVDVATVPFGADRDGYLLHAGRLSPEKGADVAIVAAARLARAVLLVGGAYDAAYVADQIAPRVRHDPSWRPGGRVDGAVYVGPRPRAEVLRIMARAAATLMPVRWDEPFGLVALESLAAGTPVAAFRRGGLVDIVDETCGALAAPDDVDAFVEATARALTRRHASCRERALRFSLDATIVRYETLLGEAIAGATR